MQKSAVARAKAKATYTSRRALPASSGFREFVAFESLGARWSARGAGPDTTGARGPTEDRPGRRRKQLTGLRRRGRREPGRPGERRGGEAWTQTPASADAAGRAKAKQLTGAAGRQSSLPGTNRQGSRKRLAQRRSTSVLSVLSLAIHPGGSGDTRPPTFPEHRAPSVGPVRRRNPSFHGCS